MSQIINAKIDDLTHFFSIFGSMKLPIGIQDFEKIRQEGWLYIDKTEYIHRIVSAGDYYFLSRPRRFGKSLLLSTLRALYEGKKELFKGLWIADHWNWEDERNVIHLKFSSQGLSTLGVERAIYAMLAEEAKRLGIVLEREGYDIQFRELIEKASNKGKVVVLIDEYDKPIVDYLDQPEQAEGHRQILKNFYSGLKDSDPYIELVFITGVSRFAKTSIFSDLNNLTNLTMHPLAAALLGVTEQELGQYLGEKIEALATVLKSDKKSIKAKVKHWYNGYSWDGTTKLYNPFSILSCLFAQQFDNFWFETGTPSFLVKKMRDTRFFNIEKMKVSDTVLDSYDLENLNPITLLFQTGYLTIDQKYRQGIYILDYPNQEVKISLEERLLNAYTYDQNGTGKVKALGLVEALESANIEEFITIINSTFSTIPAELWQKENEAFYHALVHLLCSLMGAFIQSEVNSAHGRLDAKVETKDTIYILEFKLGESAQAALKQIEEKGYFKPYQTSKLKRVGIGINFSKTKKEVEDWASQSF